MSKALFRQLSSIKVKLFLWFWLVTICAIAATRFVSVQLSQEFVKVDIAPHIQQQLATFVNVTEQAAPDNLHQFIQNISKRSKLADVARHIVIKPQQENERLIGRRKIPREAVKFIHSTTFNEQPYTWFLRHNQVSGPLTLSVNDQDFQVFYIRKGPPPKHFSVLIKQLPYWARIGTPLIVSFIFCWLLARSLSKPLSNMSNVANQFGHGDLSIRLGEDAKRNDELGDLARSFNNMADKLATNITAHQRLLGDVSHELRSPLTRLQMALALAQKNKADEQTITQYFERCELEISRLDTMLGDVLTLSRLENSSQAIIKEPLDVQKLLASLVEDGNFLAHEKQVSVLLKCASNPVLTLSHSLIASAIGNIINNAVKYSPISSKVTVTLSELEQSILITICDQGDGVPAQTLSKLFEPFYRVADDRARTTGGTGLGLAIAKQAILAHEGQISAENLSHGGLKVTISLPKS